MNDWLFVADYCVNCWLLRLSRARLVVTAAAARVPAEAEKRPRAVAVKALRAEKQPPVVRRPRAARAVRAVRAVKRLRVAATPAVRAEWPAQAGLPAQG